MFIFLLLFILSIVSTLYNFITHDFNDVVIALIFAFITGTIYIFIRKQHNEAEKFLQFLYDNKTEVRYGHVTYNNNMITADTIVTQYVFCISFVVFSIKQRSCFILNKGIVSTAIKVIYTLLTLFFGWWSIPSGPINTVKCIFINITGGHKYKVKNLIEHMSNNLESTC